MKFAVIGGGIAGLSAAWELAAATGDRAEITLYEPSQLGGKLRTTQFLGRAVDEGPDSLLTRVPEGLALCSELGLDESLEATRANRALLFSGGKLRPLPDGLVLGVPVKLAPLVRSGILSAGGIAQASLDLVRPRFRRQTDVSVYNLVASRFGRQVAERLVEPLLGSIHAGSTRQLSAAATAPQLLAAAQANRSLLMGLRRATPARQPSSAPSPLFVAPRQGMQALADRLIDRLEALGITFVPAEAAMLRQDRGGVVVEPDGGRFDGAVLAVPAPVAFSLLGTVLGESAAPPLAGMEFVSVAVTTLAFAATAFARSGTAKCPFRGSQGFWRRGGEAERDKRHPGGPRERDGNDSVFLRFPQMATLGRSGNDRRAGLGRQGERAVLGPPRRRGPRRAVLQGIGDRRRRAPRSRRGAGPAAAFGLAGKPLAGVDASIHCRAPGPGGLHKSDAGSLRPHGELGRRQL